MRKTTAFLLLLLQAAQPAAAAMSAPPPVRIVDASGAVIAAARTEVVEAWPGVYRIVASADGYYPAVHTVDGTEALADIELVARRDGRRLLLFAGDAMLSRRYFTPRAGEPVLVRPDSVAADAAQLLRHVAPYIELADIASVNLETQLASAPLADPLPKSVTFYSPAELAPALARAGFDYVALGNNHTYDYRDAGVASTLAALRKTTLGYSGMGHDAKRAARPWVTSLASGRLAFLSYVGWPGSFEPTQTATAAKGGAALGNGGVFLRDVPGAGAGAITVLQQHSGLEYSERPAMTVRSDLRTAIDAGADLAIGHHPHVLQGLEVYRGRLVAYSMGNFLFDQYIYSTQAGMLLYVWLDDERLHRAEIVALDINGYVPTPAAGRMRYAVLNRVARLSREFGSCFHESGMHAVLVPGAECPPVPLALRVEDAGTHPLSLAAAGVSPLAAVRADVGDAQYRLGTELLDRGDFESAGRFGTVDRAWIENTGIRVATHEAGGRMSQSMRFEVQPGNSLKGGMKVFERSFAPSSPATVTAALYTDDDVEVEVRMQRRRMDAGLAEALNDGPSELVGRVVPARGRWTTISLDHELPRVATRSIRLLLVVRNNAADGDAATLLVDDLGWIQWRTPWLGGEAPDVALQGTHLQLRRRSGASVD